MSSSERIAVIGLGYVGLPLAVALAARFDDVVGFDVNKKRVDSLAQGDDWTGEIESTVLKGSRLKVSSDPECLRTRSFFAITVPTPVDSNHRPDLGAVKSRSEEHTSELQSLMRISYAVFCLKKKNQKN